MIAELQDRQGRLIEIALSPEEARQHQFRPNQSVWVSARHSFIYLPIKSPRFNLGMRCILKREIKDYEFSTIKNHTRNGSSKL